MRFGLMQAPAQVLAMPVSFIPSGAPLLALDGRHSGCYFLFAKLCIEGNDDL